MNKPLPSYFYQDLFLFLHESGEVGSENAGKALFHMAYQAHKVGLEAVTLDTTGCQFEMGEENVTFPFRAECGMECLRSHFGDRFYVTFR